MENFLGQIQAFAFNFAPRGWAQCNGQLLEISKNPGLFSLLGTKYGGDGQTNFALPDLRGRVSLHQGQGEGLSDYKVGYKSGAEKVTLTVDEIPAHNHTFNVVSENSNINASGGSLLATPERPIYSDQAAPDTELNIKTITTIGVGKPHNNMQPYIAINWCIAINGIYPSKS